MKDIKKNIWELEKVESEDLVKELDSIRREDKDLIIASLKGMLLVANINKKNSGKAKTA